MNILKTLVIGGASILALLSFSSCDSTDKKNDDPAAALEEKYRLILQSPKDTRSIDVANDGSEAFDSYGPVHVTSDNIFSWVYSDMHEYGNSVTCVGKVSSMKAIQTFEESSITYAPEQELIAGNGYTLKHYCTGFDLKGNPIEYYTYGRFYVKEANKGSNGVTVFKIDYQGDCWLSRFDINEDSDILSGL